MITKTVGGSGGPAPKIGFAQGEFRMPTLPPGSPQDIVVQARRAAATRLRIQGLTFERIATEHPELGYASRQHVREDVNRHLAQLAEERRQDAGTLVQAEVEKLDRLEAKLNGILDANGLTIRNGEVVTYRGEAVIDFAPAMQAAKILLDLSQRRARLLRHDQPVKVEQGGDVNLNVRYEYAGIDPEDV